MKGVKDEDKHSDPLFPRISISDAERGGPKAPPRNKMALCEQLTIPTSHRFNNGSMTMTPLPPPSTSASLTAITPPSHVDCQNKGLFSPFSSRNGHDVSPRYHDLGARHHPHSSNGVTNSTLMAPEFRSLVPMSYQSAVHWPPPSKHSMLQPHCFLNSRNFTAEKNTKQINKVPETRDNHLKRPAFILSTRLNTLPDTASGLSSRGRDRPNANVDLSIGQKHNSLSDDEKRVNKPSIHVDHDYKSVLENKASKDCVPASSETSVRKRSASVMEGPSRSMEELGYECKSSTRLTSMDECHKDKDCGSESGEIKDESDSMSDSSAKKSISNVVVSPDDVVKYIGHENFWKAKRTILHQQKILAAQLFDLHRLVKVQRMMAESPEMIFEENFYSRKASMKLLHPRKFFAENNEHIKANLQESNFKIEHIPESAIRKPPPPPNADEVLYARPPQPIPRQMELIVPPITTDTKSSPLIFHPPAGNQWLIPVRSPSEGLVYKPYTGPLPTTAGILSPAYDNFAPITLTGVADPSFLSTPYSLPESNLQGLGNLSAVSGHSALGQSYLQPLPIPPIHASGSTSTFEPIRKFIEHPVTDQDSSILIGKPLEVCKGNELHDNAAASPIEKKTVDILSLFPTTPSHHHPLSGSISEKKIQVIKVVPHNRKSASESAARIFQTIQEERNQHG